MLARKSSYRDKYHQTSVLVESDDSCPKDIDNTVEELQVKLHFVEKKQISLKEKIIST